MAISITLDDDLATQLQLQATALNLSIEELARQILGEAVATRHDHEAAWQVCNQRRIELIRKQFAEGLSPEESSELQQLQDQADQHVEHLDEQRLDDLKQLYTKAKRIVLRFLFGAALSTPRPQSNYYSRFSSCGYEFILVML
ncbi:MAG: hypothetical protein OEU26_34100 [Candidatus Tectomicrobia bacterium]|nr:hypothetical protein [Candidatus Tectomicrobia bacterium]